jgi:hypothetical protein
MNALFDTCILPPDPRDPIPVIVLVAAVAAMAMIHYFFL